MVVYAYFLYKSIKKDRGRKHIKRSKNTLKDILNGKNKKVELSLACLILIISLTTGIYDSFDMINKDFKEMNGTIIKIENGIKNPLTQEITIKNNSETLKLYVRRIDVRDHPDIFKIGEVVQIEFQV